MNLINRLICKLPRWMGGGHKRMKRVPAQTDYERTNGIAHYRCPRCGWEETRKVRVKP